MNDEEKRSRIRNEIAYGNYENVVQAGTIHGGVHVTAGGADSPSALEDPVIVTVHRKDRPWLAVDADPPRWMSPSGLSYIVTLEARTVRAVVLRAARVVVLSRRLPRPAYLPAPDLIGARPSMRHFEADLSTVKSSPPPFDTDSPQLLPIGPDFPFTISATDIEQFKFTATAGSEEVCWQVELDWICAGQQGTTVINDNGHPFETYPSGVFAGPGSWALEENRDTYREGLRRRIDEEHRLPPPSSTWSRSISAEEVFLAALALDSDMRDVDPDDPAAWEAYQQLATYVRTLLGQERFRSDRSEPFRALLIRVIRFFYASGQSDLGRRIAGSVYEDWRRHLGQDHPHTLALANRLGGCLVGMRRYGEARSVFESILPLFRKTLGKKHSDTLTVTSNLALVLGRLGELDTAEKLARKVIRTSARVLGDDHLTTRRTLRVIDEITEQRQAKEQAR
ncbi:tetratricopeptide repeat protein [Streptomyces johnsoniae]|uniref:Tetratricopeptide repeat protein n=1 Tax=Streptomyces johnsoniae TaxID=3075532 RepID=A0ABU2S535_9ACTN|nr:tetratricopeptide repeat protein [Streptomyces sp. DSM 41886]MDT0444055.1 tetratricopeptide repeat protein [Streptomyces sp. DSM 41886]